MRRHFRRHGNFQPDLDFWLPVKLAVLGTDADVVRLVEAALAVGHQVVWLGDVRIEESAAVSALTPGLPVAADWESLMDHGLVDAVLVGRGTADAELRAEQLKRLVADAVPLLVVHPATASVLTYYELDMARRESHAVVRHFTPLAGSPAVADFAEWVRAGTSELGAIHQIIAQRWTADCSRDSVLRHLARDVELLRAESGSIHTVSAIGPQASDASFASLQAQLTGPSDATLRWSVAPSSDRATRVELSLVGERGSARLQMPSDGEPELEVTTGGQTTSRPIDPWHGPAAAIDGLANAIQANGTEQSAAASTWQDATAAMEIVDAIELSLQKRRTIEVHQQRLTQQLAFRGTMAAFGCGLLLLVLAIAVIVGIVGGVESILQRPLIGAWPIMLLLVLMIFLLLQVVPWLAVKRRAAHADVDDPNPNGQ